MMCDTLIPDCVLGVVVACVFACQCAGNAAAASLAGA